MYFSYVEDGIFTQLKTLLTCCSRPVPFWLIALLILSSNQLLFFSCFPFRKILQWLRFGFFFRVHTCNLRQKNVYDRCVGVALCVYTFFLSFSDKTSYVPQATAFSCEISGVCTWIFFGSFVPRTQFPMYCLKLRRFRIGFGWPACANNYNYKRYGLGKCCFSDEFTFFSAFRRVSKN